MIYAVHTLDVRPQSLPEVEQTLAVACIDAVASRDLVASFHTEIGPLNQVTQLWGIESETGKKRVRAQAAVAARALGELLLRERCEEITPFEVSPALPTTAVGPFFEIRRYRYAEGDLDNIVAAWEAALPARLALGPLVLIGSSEVDGARTLLHIWPYRTLDERWALRREIRAASAWPPHVVAARLGLPGYTLHEMETKIVVPSAFSPLQ